MPTTNACNQVHPVRSLILFQAEGKSVSCEKILFGVIQASSYCVQFHALSVPYEMPGLVDAHIFICCHEAKIDPVNTIYELPAKTLSRRAPGSALSCSRACSACSSSRGSSWTRRTSTASTSATSAPSTSSRYLPLIFEISSILINSNFQLKG